MPFDKCDHASFIGFRTTRGLLCACLFGLLHCAHREAPCPIAAESPLPAQCGPARDTLLCAVQIYAEEARRILGPEKVVPPERFLPWFDSVAKEAATRLPPVVEPDRQVDLLKKIVYTDLGIAFDSDQNDIRTLLPHAVVARKRGSCLGVSLLMLILAERLDVPLRGVLIPTHFFVRYDHPSYRVNIEPNKAGFPRTDQYYREMYRIPSGSWYDLGSLTKAQTLAVLCFNLGNAYRAAGSAPEAVRMYRRSIGGLPGFAEALGNLAVVLDEQGNPRGAADALLAARAIRPDLQNLSKNLGFAYLRLGEPARAREEFLRAISESADDPDNHYGAACAFSAMGEKSRARESIRKALDLRPDWPQARDLGRKLER
jgi:regulator of sirC expression with transglutaminase-like and TPR domain